MGRTPGECVFVDDLPHNIHAAAGLGIAGVRHTSYDETLSELQSLFGIDLS
jgi:FMN phosphatase YigB (HAD superfamily)